MRCDIIDDYVWEHYETWNDDKIMGFKNIMACFFWNNVDVYIDNKSKEHREKRDRFIEYKERLTNIKLQESIEPFITQQHKLKLAYDSIYVNTVSSPYTP